MFRAGRDPRSYSDMVAPHYGLNRKGSLHPALTHRTLGPQAGDTVWGKCELFTTKWVTGAADLVSCSLALCPPTACSPICYNVSKQTPVAAARASRQHELYHALPAMMNRLYASKAGAEENPCS